MDFINNFDTETIFNLIKSRYKTETGQTIQIGSDEFATASVVAYVFGLMISRFNEQAKQRYLATATGEYLNALAETFGISRPKPVHATCVISLVCDEGYEITITKDFTVSYRGIKFHPMEQTTDYTPIREIEFIGSDSNANVLDENNIDSGTEFVIDTPIDHVLSATSLDVTSGASDIFPMTDSGDDAFREYIKLERAAMSVAGPAMAYERKALGSDSRILDVYCLRYDDDGFIPGTAKMYILVSDEDYADSWSEIRLNVMRATNSDSVRPVCDVVEIHRASYISVSISVYVRVSAQYGATWYSKVMADIASYTATLNSKLGAIFSISELSKLCRTPADDGTVVELIQCNDPSQSIITPDKWEARRYTIEVSSYEVI